MRFRPSRAASGTPSMALSLSVGSGAVPVPATQAFAVSIFNTAAPLTVSDLEGVERHVDTMLTDSAPEATVIAVSAETLVAQREWTLALQVRCGRRFSVRLTLPHVCSLSPPSTSS